MYITCAYELTKYMLRYVVEGHVCRYILYISAPSMQSAIALEFIPVHRMIFAPPRALSASDGFCALESMKWVALCGETASIMVVPRPGACHGSENRGGNREVKGNK